MLVIAAFKNNDPNPWRLQHRWLNCFKLTRQVQIFFYSHIFREENSCVYKLDDNGIICQGFVRWTLIPYFILEDFFRNIMFLIFIGTVFVPRVFYFSSFQ